MRYWPTPLHYQPKLWVHAVSVGEAIIAKALLSDYKVRDNVLLTTTTQAGYKMLHELYGRRHVRYLPWDLPGCYRRLFDGRDVPPLVVVETEIWPNLFPFVTAHQSQVLIVNGRLSAKTLRMQKNLLLRRTLSKVSHVMARSDRDRQRFLAFGIDPERIQVTGNIKFDFVPKTLEAGVLLDWLKLDESLLIFASVSADEVSLLVPELDQILAKHPDLRVLWAPRHLEELETHRQALSHYQPELRSQLQGQPRVVVLDSFGELSGCYAYGKLSVVGGSFNNRGGQNFLESLQAGTPVLIGPSFENFRLEVEEALSQRCILTLNQASEVSGAVDALIGDLSSLQRMRAAAQKFLASHGGAIERTRQELLNLGIVLEPKSPKE